MERITLHAEKRENTGKGAARSLRRSGVVPAVLYRGGSSTPIKINAKELTTFMRATAGEQVMVDLQFTDGDKKLALMKEYQVDPLKGELLHTDFFEVSLTEEIRVTVHVTTTGEPIGVKRDGGILQHGVREIEIQCLPDRVPGHVEVDVAGLETGKSIHVGDLLLGEGIKVLTDAGELIATVGAPIVEEKVEAVAAAPEVAEPEVIKKGKKEEEAAGAKA
ncbi:MAG: 50S ribosomal protein L25 [Nitrospirae bacterium]|nr:50S ribosomal protein L25 [Nitrospirota bacterium]MCL5421823.1 50S ribosomal protein L25 [Nitrospirota bacterium]